MIFRPTGGEDSQGLREINAQAGCTGDDIVAGVGKLAGDAKDQAVTLSSLCAILKVEDNAGRTGGWSKHRWRVRPYELGGEAVARFERLRREYDEAIVLGSPRCVTTTPCA